MSNFDSLLAEIEGQLDPAPDLEFQMFLRELAPLLSDDRVRALLHGRNEAAETALDYYRNGLSAAETADEINQNWG